MAIPRDALYGNLNSNEAAFQTVPSLQVWKKSKPGHRTGGKQDLTLVHTKGNRLLVGRNPAQASMPFKCLGYFKLAKGCKVFVNTSANLLLQLTHF